MKDETNKFNIFLKRYRFIKDKKKTQGNRVTFKEIEKSHWEWKKIPNDETRKKILKKRMKKIKQTRVNLPTVD